MSTPGNYSLESSSAGSSVQIEWTHVFGGKGDVQIHNDFLFGCFSNTPPLEVCVSHWCFVCLDLNPPSSGGLSGVTLFCLIFCLSGLLWPHPWCPITYDCHCLFVDSVWLDNKLNFKVGPHACTSSFLYKRNYAILHKLPNSRKDFYAYWRRWVRKMMQKNISFGYFCWTSIYTQNNEFRICKIIKTWWLFREKLAKKFYFSRKILAYFGLILGAKDLFFKSPKTSFV